MSDIGGGYKSPTTGEGILPGADYPNYGTTEDGETTSVKRYDGYDPAATTPDNPADNGNPYRLSGLPGSVGLGSDELGFNPDTPTHYGSSAPHPISAADMRYVDPGQDALVQRRLPPSPTTPRTVREEQERQRAQAETKAPPILPALGNTALLASAGPNTLNGLTADKRSESSAPDNLANTSRPTRDVPRPTDTPTATGEIIAYVPRKLTPLETAIVQFSKDGAGDYTETPRAAIISGMSRVQQQTTANVVAALAVEAHHRGSGNASAVVVVKLGPGTRQTRLIRDAAEAAGCTVEQYPIDAPDGPLAALPPHQLYSVVAKAAADTGEAQQVGGKAAHPYEYVLSRAVPPLLYDPCDPAAPPRRATLLDCARAVSILDNARIRSTQDPFDLTPDDVPGISHTQAQEVLDGMPVNSLQTLAATISDLHATLATVVHDADGRIPPYVSHQGEIERIQGMPPSAATRQQQLPDRPRVLVVDATSTCAGDTLRGNLALHVVPYLIAPTPQHVPGGVVFAGVFAPHAPSTGHALKWCDDHDVPAVLTPGEFGETILPLIAGGKVIVEQPGVEQLELLAGITAPARRLRVSGTSGGVTGNNGAVPAPSQTLNYDLTHTDAAGRPIAQGGSESHNTDTPGTSYSDTVNTTFEPSTAVTKEEFAQLPPNMTVVISARGYVTGLFHTASGIPAPDKFPPVDPREQALLDNIRNVAGVVGAIEQKVADSKGELPLRVQAQISRKEPDNDELTGVPPDQAISTPNQPQGITAAPTRQRPTSKTQPRRTTDPIQKPQERQGPQLGQRAPWSITRAIQQVPEPRTVAQRQYMMRQEYRANRLQDETEDSFYRRQWEAQQEPIRLGYHSGEIRSFEEWREHWGVPVPRAKRLVRGIRRGIESLNDAANQQEGDNS